MIGVAGKRNPWYPMYPGDFETDENVKGMTDEEVGFYVRCLNHCWINGSIPGNLVELARVMGRPIRTVRRLWRAVGKCFVPVDSGSNSLIRLGNKRLLEELQKIENRRNSAKFKATLRWAKIDSGNQNAQVQTYQKNADATAMPQQCHSIATAMQTVNATALPRQCHGNANHNHNHIIQAPPTPPCPDGAPLDEFFEERYRAHPKKRDRTLAEQYMSQIPGIETAETQDEFRRGHDAWIRSEEWRWKNGAKAQTLAQFILDQGWKYPPQPDDDDSGEVPMISTEEFERLHPPSSEGVDPYAEWIPSWEDEKRKREVAGGTHDQA